MLERRYYLAFLDAVALLDVEREEAARDARQKFDALYGVNLHVLDDTAGYRAVRRQRLRPDDRREQRRVGGLVEERLPSRVDPCRRRDGDERDYD